MANPTKRIYVTPTQEAALRRVVDAASHTPPSTVDHTDVVSCVRLLSKLDVAKEHL